MRRAFTLAIVCLAVLLLASEPAKAQQAGNAQQGNAGGQGILDQAGGGILDAQAANAAGGGNQAQLPGQAASGFVGRGAASVFGGAAGGAGGGGGGFTGGGGRGGGGFGGGAGGGRGTTQRGGQAAANQRTIVRPRIRIAFRQSSRSADDIGSSLQSSLTAIRQRIERLEGRPSFRGIQIAVGDAGRVTLSGQVQDEGSKRLAAILTRLEPGVRSIDNQITVPNSAIELPDLDF